MPEPTHPESLLTKHEEGIMTEYRASLGKIENHRSDEFNRKILPFSEKIVHTIGHRLAYDAAVDAGLDSRIVDLFLYSVVHQDEAWYSEVLGISRQSQFDREDAALQAALPHLDSWMQQASVDHVITSPIVTRDRWDQFVSQLEIARPADSPLTRTPCLPSAHL
jgi:hypothetical protein